MQAWRAFGGTRGIKGVEVSADGGKTWQAAKLIGPDGPFAWRQFALPVRLEAGTHVLASRATDTAGNVGRPSSARKTWAATTTRC